MTQAPKHTGCCACVIQNVNDENKEMSRAEGTNSLALDATTLVILWGILDGLGTRRGEVEGLLSANFRNVSGSCKGQPDLSSLDVQDADRLASETY